MNIFLAILFSLCFMWSYVNCWPNKTPKNLTDSSLCISQWLIISFGWWKEILTFLLGLWKNEYFVLTVFKDSLFTVNQSLTFNRLLFTTVKKCLMSLWLKKRLVSSANMIGSNRRDALLVLLHIVETEVV